jgi:hypothetical protein
MMQVRFGDRTFTFPDDATDDEIAEALEATGGGAPAADPAPPPAPAAEPSPLEAETARIAKERTGVPTVPTYTAEGQVRTPEMEARDLLAKRERDAAEKQIYEGRTARDRFRDTGGFALQAPVRAVSRGEYGLSDILRSLGGETLPAQLEEAEGDFAWANQAGLETAAALGEGMAGIPFLNTMGAVPGQMTRSMAAATRELPRDLRHFMKSERGSAMVPGGGGGPRIPAGPATTADDIAARLDEKALTGERPMTRNELIAAGERIRNTTGVDFQVPTMVAGNTMERHLAGGLATIPYAGTPVVNAWDRGLFQLGQAKDALQENMGAAGSLGAGSAVRTRVADWMKNPTALDDTRISQLYDEVGASVKDVPVELSNLRRLQRALVKEKETSTTGEHDASLKLIEDMLDRKQFPKGMPYRDILQKRKEIGARTSGKIVNEAGTSQTTLDRIYGAMTDDLKFAIRRGGGQKALAKWEEANTSAQNVAEQRKVLARLIGEKGDVPPEKIVARIKEMGRSRRGDVTALRILKRIMPEDEFNDLSATYLDDMGRNRKGDWSIFHFSSDYGQMSNAAKHILFGESKAAVDDLVSVTKAFERLHGQSWNTSKTGIANAVMQLVMNPIAVLGLGAGVLTDIGTAGAAGGTAAGFRAGRSMAWALSKPAVAREASKVFRAYYRAVRAGEGIAAREAGLAASIRSYSTALAAETGGNAAEIEKAMIQRLNQIRRGERK